MYCVIQEIKRKHPSRYGEHKEIEVQQDGWTIDGKPARFGYGYSEERFDRPHLEAYKISIHQSYRENGKMKKRQYSITTMGYYDLVEWSLYDCCNETRLKNIAAKLNIELNDLYEVVYGKLEPLQQRITAEFEQTEEFKARKEHRRIIEAYQNAKNAFIKQYGCDKDDYDRCYDVFGVLRNKDYLAQIKRECKAREADQRSYQDNWRSNYSYSGGSYDYSSYFNRNRSTYTETEKKDLKKFYKLLSVKFHPDVNPDKDTTKEMQLLNKLKEEWGV